MAEIDQAPQTRLPRRDGGRFGRPRPVPPVEDWTGKMFRNARMAQNPDAKIPLTIAYWILGVAHGLRAQGCKFVGIGSCWEQDSESEEKEGGIFIFVPYGPLKDSHLVWDAKHIPQPHISNPFFNQGKEDVSWIELEEGFCDYVLINAARDGEKEVMWSWEHSQFYRVGKAPEPWTPDYQYQVTVFDWQGAVKKME